ncbi:YrbL family protein [Cereibacter changlensis]
MHDVNEIRPITRLERNASSAAATDSSWHDDSWSIRLSELEPVAEGRESAVYIRPGKPSQLIKVCKQRNVKTRGLFAAIKGKLRHRRSLASYRTFLRQGHAYLEATVQAAIMSRPPPLAHMRGVLLTDFGLGVIVQKIRDGDGNIAPTLASLIKHEQIDHAVLREALNRFASDMSAFHIIGYDLNLTNLVYETRRGRSRIVLVDGYGSRSIIPIRRWSSRINNMCLARQFRVLAGKLGMLWDDRSWTFEARKNGQTAPYCPPK